MSLAEALLRCTGRGNCRYVDQRQDLWSGLETAHRKVRFQSGQSIDKVVRTHCGNSQRRRQIRIRRNTQTYVAENFNACHPISGNPNHPLQCESVRTGNEYSESFQSRREMDAPRVPITPMTCWEKPQSRQETLNVYMNAYREGNQVSSDAMPVGRY